MTKLITPFFVFVLSQNLIAADGYLVKIKADDHSFLRNHSFEYVTDNVIRIPDGELDFVQSRSEVIYIEPNHELIPYNVPDDLTKDQWGIKNPQARGADANVVEAWKKQTGSKKVVVAIIDTGVDVKHPDLKDNIWDNLAEVNGKDGVDDDGNGYIDDYHGWSIFYDNNDLYDYRRHGTHVAGIVGAKGNNGIGVVGVNWDVSLMVLNFFPKKEKGNVADAIKAIDYAINNGAHIINASWGAHPDEVKAEEFKILSEAIKRAEDKNVLFVAAAGNSGDNNDALGHVPASLKNKNIVSVGAMTRNGWPPSFSNYGQKTVDIFAPGSVVKSTLPGNYYGSLNGTSMAAPFVAGAAALLLAENPKLTWLGIKARLLKTCKTNRNLRQICVCKGHLDVAKALEN